MSVPDVPRAGADTEHLRLSLAACATLGIDAEWVEAQGDGRMKGWGRTHELLR